MRPSRGTCGETMADHTSDEVRWFALRQLGQQEPLRAGVPHPCGHAPRSPQSKAARADRH
eukprot:365042-Chlamydomonas_euryale.AAC.32